MSSENSLQVVLRQHPRALTIVAASVIGLLLPVPWLIRNYNAYIDLEPGGLPHNAWGWLISTLMKPFGKETLSTKQYDLDSNKETWLRRYGALPKKDRERPTLSWHYIPHRQLDQFSNRIVANVSNISTFIMIGLGLIKVLIPRFLLRC